MESTLSTLPSAFTPFSFSKPLNPKSPLFSFSQSPLLGHVAVLSYSFPLRTISSIPKRLHRRLECVSSGTGGEFGGNDGSSGGGGGGGGEGTGGGDSKAKLGAGVVDDLSALSPDVIILNVGGMMCGGCASSVKKILESQPQVSSATVDLKTATAMVWPVSEAKAVPNWQKELGEALAKQLTSSGFESELRGMCSACM
ncbi:Putative copper-transporting ATPase PAA1 -like protein [Gossypium arboreum]|uniref:Putative copper-transporting ATPase PAA1-like protein n=1 Tax=Gossypium arboreum TaxID=29729 RepID=A0A0B0PZZ6_GOSAR|nr:Putative copper-transporting ATPase PAA1 -like protein [Gossypium arboreum]